MTEEDQTLAEIRTYIMSLPIDQQIAVKEAAEALSAVIEHHGDAGSVALAYLGAALAAKG